MKRILLSAGNIIRATLLLIFTILAANGAFAQIYTDSSNIGCGIALPTNGSATLTINNVPPPAGDATLTMYYKGDLDGGVPGNETFTLFDENNVLIGISDPTIQCGVTYASKTFTIPVADVSIWAADGVMDFTVTPGTGVNTGTCTDHCAYLIIEYPSVTAPNNAGVRSLDAPVNFCAGQHNILVTIVNSGTNIINTVTVNWEFNGVAQTPIVHNSPIDTFGGVNPYTAQINLGAKNFQNGILKSIKVWTHKPNGQNDTVNVNDTILRMVQPSLMGTFTIGGGSADYPDFTSAVNDLNSFGVCGSVIFNVNSGSGPFNEQLKLGAITGASAVNTITFNGNGESLEPTNTTLNERSAIAMDNAAYFRFQNLIIDASKAPTYGWGVHLSGGSHHNQFSSCDIISSSTNTSSANSNGIVISGSNTSAATAGNASDNSFLNNRIIGGYYGVRFNGETGSLNCKNNVLMNNQILDFYFYGIYLDDTDGTIIEGNDISRMTRANASGTFYGFSLFGGTINTLFSKNRIHHSHEATNNLTGTSYGIFISNADAPKGSENIIVNNIIDHIEFNGTIYGIYNSGSDGIYSYHNTISLDDVNATGGITRAIYQTSVADNIKFYNNTISITRGGSDIKHGLYFNTATTSIESDYNIVYMNSAGTGAQHFGFFGSDQTTLSDWQSVNSSLYDQNTVDGNPQFANIANGDFTITNQALNNTGLDIGVTDDYNNKSRCAIPDVGAVENRLFMHANDAGILSLNEPVSFCPGGRNVVVTLQNYANAPLNSVTINWTINGTPQTPVNFNTPLDTFCGFTNTSAQVTLGSSNFVAGQLYTIKAWTVNPNGVADQNPINDTLEAVVSPALIGTFTIGGVSPDFNKFSDAVEALSERGVCAPVVFNVRNGNYNEQISLRNISGISSVNTITFQSESGDSSMVNLNFTAVNSAENYVLNIDGVDYLSFKNMTFEAMTPNFGNVIVFSNKSNSHNSFLNCEVIGSRGNSTSTFNSIFRSLGGTHSNITIKNCYIHNGSIGIDFDNNVGCVDNEFSHNKIEPYYIGIRASGHENIKVSHNNILSNTTGTYNFAFGINLENCIGAIEIRKNQIEIVTGAYGIYFFNCTGDSLGNSIIANNFISVGGSSGTVYGIYKTGITSYLNFYNNSIYVAGGSSNSIGMASFSSGTDNNYINNIYFVEGAGFAFRVSNPVSVGISDYNDFYTESINFVNWGTPVQDLAALITLSGKDSNSVEADPGYFSFSNLHATSGALNNRGIYLATVPDDFDGESRSLIDPDIGADEFIPPPDDIGVLAFISPQPYGCDLSDSTAVEIAIYNYGSQPQFNFSVSYRIYSIVVATETINTILLPGDTLFYTFTKKVDLTVPAVYPFNAWTVMAGDLNPNNDSLLFNPIFSDTLISDFPYVEDFDNSFGSIPNYWRNETTEGDEDWYFHNGFISGLPTQNGITKDHTTGSGSYAWTDNSFVNSARINLLSPCLDISGLTNPYLEFYYWNIDVTNSQILHIDVWRANEWIEDITAPLGFQLATEWGYQLIDLTPFGGGDLKIRFRAEEIGTGTLNDIAIDDIKVFNLGPVNLSVVDYFTPNTACELTDIEPLEIKLIQFGYDTLHIGSQIPISFNVNGGPAFFETITLTKPLGQFDTLEYLFNSSVDLSQPGDYIIKVWTGHPLDDDMSNDTLTIYANHTVDRNYPAIQDFESFTVTTNATGFDNNWYTVPTSTTIDYRWTPNSGITVSGGTGPSFDHTTGFGKYIYTESSNGATGTVAEVYTSCYDLNGLTNPGINFAYHLFGTTMGVLHVDINVNGTWIDDFVAPFTGNLGDSWNIAAIKLGSFQNSIVSLRFRAVKGTGGSGDMAIDDFIVGELPVVGLGDTIRDCGSVTLSAGNSGDIYQWSTGENTQTITVLGNPNVQTMTNISLTVFNSMGLQNFDDVLVILDPGPALDLGPDTLVCGPSSIVLDAENPGMSYLWEDQSTQQTHAVSANGKYYVRVDNGAGCIKSDTLNVSFDDLPVADFNHQKDAQGQIVTFNNTSSFGITYLWDFGDGFFSTAQNPMHFYQPGIYVVKLLVTNICGTDTIAYLVNGSPIGIDGLSTVIDFEIFPVPATDQIYVNINLDRMMPITISLYDLNGKLVYYDDLGSKSIHIQSIISRGLYPSGFYYIKVGVGDRNLVRKVVFD